MCEYCGCQALDAVAELTAEHDAVVELVGRVNAALRSGRPRDAIVLTRQIVELLGPHTAVEEEALFPALAVDFPEHVRRLVDQHRIIERVLAEVPTDPAGAGSTGAGSIGAGSIGAGSTGAGPTWADRLIDALYLLREHILAEQDGVFPAALGALEPDQWAAVESVRARVGSGLPGRERHAAPAAS